MQGFLHEIVKIISKWSEKRDPMLSEVINSAEQDIIGLSVFPARWVDLMLCIVRLFDDIIDLKVYSWVVLWFIGVLKCPIRKLEELGCDS